MNNTKIYPAEGTWDDTARLAVCGLLVVGGLASRSKFGVLAALLGGGLLSIDLADPERRAVIKQKVKVKPKPASVARAATFLRSPEEVYEFWSRPENLVRIIPGVESIQPGPDNRWTWRASPVASQQISWETQLVHADRPNEIIWSSTEGAPIHHVGKLKLRPAPGNRGTEAILTLTWEVQAPFSEAMNYFAAKGAGWHASEALRRAKQLLETGELAVA